MLDFILRRDDIFCKFVAIQSIISVKNVQFRKDPQKNKNGESSGVRVAEVELLPGVMEG